MKKTLLILTGIGLACLFVSASVWEGAGAVSTNGELPDNGFYVATNSFPRNTVVDITNLETRQTTRAIVTSGLDSPGLLVMLSREAADIIGLKGRSIGRIRMSMPGDPAAFSRMSEGSSGDPDFDPMAAVANDYPWLLSNESTGRSENMDFRAEPAESPPSAGAPAPVYAWERLAELAPLETENTDTGIESEAEVVWVYPEEIIAGEVPYAASPLITETPDIEEAPFIIEAPELAEAPEPDPVPEIVEVPEIAETPEIEETPEIAETPEIEEAPEIAEAPEIEEAPEIAETPAAEGPVETLTLVPAEERPPAPLEPGIVYETKKPPTVIAETPPAIVASPPRESVSPIVSHEAPGVRFSVPEINSLERGKYYLQIAAFSYPESVESAIGRLDKGYPVKVQISGSQSRPIYRILLGPLNQGESGAMLERFKTTGYNDAFIRQE